MSEACRLLGDAFQRDGDHYKLDHAVVATVEQLFTAVDRVPPAEAARLTEQALTLWRGEPLSGSGYAC